MSGPRTIAEQRWATLAPDRARWLEEIREGAKGWPGLTANLEAVAEQIAEVGDSASEMIDALMEPIVTQLKRSGRDWARDPGMLVVGATPDDDVLASMTPFSDSSGLVLISDATSALIHYLARLAVWWLNPSRSKLRQIVSVIRAGRSPQRVSRDPRVQLSTALLRYYFIHQRFFGLSGRLAIALPETDEDLVNLLTFAGSTFVLSHEYAHFVFGHLPRCASTDEQHLHEYQADALALKTTTELFEVFGEHNMTVALLGARLGLLAVEGAEEALFVRRPLTHPHSDERWRRLQLDRSVQGAAVEPLLIGTTTALHAAARVTSPLPSEHWQAVLSTPEISLEGHDMDYYGTVPELDRLTGFEVDRHYALLDDFRDRGVVDLATSVARAPHEGAVVALRDLGVAERWLARLADDTQGLSHHSLLHAVGALPVLAARTPTERSVLANSAALVLRAYLPGAV